MSESHPFIATARIDVRPPDERTLQLLQTICRTHLARVRPLVFRPAQTEEERVATYRMRCNTVLDRGWATPEKYPDGLEHDAFDVTALHIIGLDGSTPIASARLVFPTDVAQLPTEQAFDLRIEPHDLVADMGRQIVVRSYTSQQHSIFAALLAQCWLETCARGHTYVCGDFTPAMIRLYRRMGMAVTALGPPRLHWGEERIPIVQDAPGAVAALAARWLGGA